MHNQYMTDEEIYYFEMQDKMERKDRSFLLNEYNGDECDEYNGVIDEEDRYLEWEVREIYELQRKLKAHYISFCYDICGKRFSKIMFKPPKYFLSRDERDQIYIDTGKRIYHQEKRIMLRRVILCFTRIILQNVDFNGISRDDVLSAIQDELESTNSISEMKRIFRIGVCHAYFRNVHTGEYYQY